MNQAKISQANWELEPQNDLGYGKLFAIFWRRRFWFMGVFCGILAVSIPLALMKKPIYQSYMQILVEPNYQGKSDTDKGEFADTNVEVDYATQLKVLKSSEILKRAIDKLDLEYTEETENQVIEALKESLNVYQIVDSNSERETQTKIVQTVYTGESPIQTKTVLEALQEVYLEYNLEQQEKRLQNGLNFINDRLPEARDSLVEAEAALTQLSKEHNLVSPEEEAIAIKDNIRNIAQEREILKAEQNQKTGNYTTLQEQLGLSTKENSIALSRLSQSTRYQNILNELQQIDIALADERSRFTDDNPVIQDLIRQQENQKALLVAEARRVLGTIPPGFIAELESLREKGQLVNSDTEFIDSITQTQADLVGIQERETSLAQTEAKLRQNLDQFPELIARYRNLAQEAEVKREALQSLLEAKQELEIELSRGGFSWQVIEPPKLGMQIGPNLSKDMLLSVVIATFLGGSAAFIREAMDDTISDSRDIERQTALPILGTAPELSLSSSNSLIGRLPLFPKGVPTSIRDVIQWQPFRESLDIIYENVRLFSSNSPLKSLAVTSATAGEGKSTFILGLALSIARHNQKVLVIDGDLRSPSIHHAFELKNQSGLTNYLADETTHPHIEAVSFMGVTIDIIPSGTIPTDPVKLLNSPKLKDLLDRQKPYYDLILIDTPSAIGMVDAIKIGSICDRTVLMTRLDKVKSSEVAEATALLSKLDVLGIVANGSKEVTQKYEARSQYLLPQQV